MIIGLIDLLIETPEIYGDALPPPLFQDLGIVHRNCEHLADMINDVLALSQLERGQLALHKENVDLTETIDGAITMVRPLLEKKGLTLEVTVPNDLPLIYCDQARIRSREQVWAIAAAAARNPGRLKRTAKATLGLNRPRVALVLLYLTAQGCADSARYMRSTAPSLAEVTISTYRAR